MNSSALAARAAAAQLGRRRVGLAHAEVLLDGAVEEIGVLAHHRDEAAELVERQVAQVAAADQ